MLQSPLTILESQLVALSHQDRLSIIRVLREKGALITVDIGKELSVGTSNITYHLRFLYELEFVGNTREGHTKLYYVNEQKIDQFLESLKLFLKGNSNANSGTINSTTTEDNPLRSSGMREDAFLHDSGGEGSTSES